MYFFVLTNQNGSTVSKVGINLHYIPIVFVSDSLTFFYLFDWFLLRRDKLIYDFLYLDTLANQHNRRQSSLIYREHRVR